MYIPFSHSSISTKQTQIDNIKLRHIIMKLSKHKIAEFNARQGVAGRFFGSTIFIPCSQHSPYHPGPHKHPDDVILPSKQNRLQGISWVNSSGQDTPPHDGDTRTYRARVEVPFGPHSAEQLLHVVQAETSQLTRKPNAYFSIAVPVLNC